MFTIALLLFFSALVAFPGFYIITRAMFPRMSKKKSGWIGAGLTFLLLVALLGMMGFVKP